LASDVALTQLDNNRKRAETTQTFRNCCNIEGEAEVLGQNDKDSGAVDLASTVPMNVRRA